MKNEKTNKTIQPNNAKTPKKGEKRNLLQKIIDKASAKAKKAKSAKLKQALANDAMEVDLLC